MVPLLYEDEELVLVLVAFSVTPLGVGEDVGEIVSKAIKVVF
jgi:uncharacterized protein YqgV (UPF0045/DUF77 family)